MYTNQRGFDQLNFIADALFTSSKDRVRTVLPWQSRAETAWNALSLGHGCSETRVELPDKHALQDGRIRPITH
jgi:hypothetical protein